MPDMDIVPQWTQLAPGGSGQRLPVYLLIDTSSSMAGASIQAVKNGLETFKHEVAGDPFAREVVHVGFIRFGSDAKMEPDRLVPISDFQPPQLQAEGVTRLDRALEVLIESLGRDVRRSVRGGQRGDFRPNVFILTDGRPTDESGRQTDKLWQPVKERLVNPGTGKVKVNSIVVFGCGPGIDDETIKNISTGIAFKMDSDQASFSAMFRYISNTTTSASRPGSNPSDPLVNIQPSSVIVRIP